MQNKQILEYLQSGKKLTPLEALNLFGCLRLGARIYDLKQKGFNITSKTVRKNGKTFAEYELSAS